MYASFSGQSVYNDWYLSLYNVFFTSLPVIALGVFDQDVSANFCLKVPHANIFHFSDFFLSKLSLLVLKNTERKMEKLSVYMKIRTLINKILLS